MKASFNSIAYVAAAIALVLMVYAGSYYLVVQRYAATFYVGSGQLVVFPWDIDTGPTLVGNDYNGPYARAFELPLNEPAEIESIPAVRHLGPLRRGCTHGYRISGSFVEFVFAPMLQVDRMIRPNYWSDYLAR